MCNEESVPRDADEAAERLVRLLMQYGPNTEGVKKMLQRRWTTVTSLAHKIHNARKDPRRNDLELPSIP